MEIKIASLLAVSVIGTAFFVGCSCARSVNNDTDDMNKIEMESNITMSSDTAKLTTSISSSTLKETSEETTTKTTTNTSVTQTSKSIPVQYVGDPNSRVTTAKSVVTQVVVVTVTLPKTTETTTTTTEAITTTETTIATYNVPDGMFIPVNDMIFRVNDIAVKAGDIQPSLESYSPLYISDSTPVHGGTSARLFCFEEFNIITESFTNEDGTSNELVTEIVLNGDNVHTNKGIKKGSLIDDMYAAYGTDQCLNEETNIYRYKTDDSYVLEFCTDGSYVTEIKYYMSIE